MIANGFLDSKILLFFIMAVVDSLLPYAYFFFLNLKKEYDVTLLEHAFVAAIRAYYSINLTKDIVPGNNVSGD